MMMTFQKRHLSAFERWFRGWLPQHFWAFLRREDGFLNVVGTAPTAGPQTVSIAIVERSITGYAPDTVTVEATAANFPGVAAVTSIHDESVQKIDFIWSFGDPTATYDYKTRSFGQSNNPNYDIGKKASHCYSQPGTYTITCTARMWSGGQIITAQDTLQVTVGDVEGAGTSYTQIAFIDASGNFAGSPATGGRNYTSFTACLNGLNGGNPANNTLIIFRDGTSTTEPSGFNSWDSTMPSMRVRTLNGGRATVNVFGSNAAIFYLMESQPNHANKEMVFENIDFQGEWNELTENGGTDNTVILFGGTRTAGNITEGAFQYAHQAWYNCTFDGMATTYSGGGFGTTPAEGSSVHFHNCDFSNFADFSILSSHELTSFYGNRQVRAAAALAGGPKGGQRFNTHAGFRCAGLISLVSQNDCMSNSGWFIQGSGSPPLATYNGNPITDSQPNIRLGTEPVLGAYHKAVLNVVEGGVECIHMQSANNVDLVAINYNVESNLCIGSWMTQRAIGISSTGGRVVNNLFVVPDIAGYTLAGLAGPATPLGVPTHVVGADFNFQSWGSSTENANGSLVIAYNGAVNRSGRSFDGIVNTSFLLTYQPNYNITSARNAIDQVNGGTDQNLDRSTVFNALNTADYQYRYPGTPDTFVTIPTTATPAGTPTLGVPNPGSPLLNATDVSSGVLYSTIDLLGNDRGGGGFDDHWPIVA